MWKKWAIAAIAYLVLVMAGYGTYTAIAGPNSMPANQEEMNK